MALGAKELRRLQWVRSGEASSAKEIEGVVAVEEIQRERAAPELHHRCALPATDCPENSAQAARRFFPSSNASLLPSHLGDRGSQGGEGERLADHEIDAGGLLAGTAHDVAETGEQ